MYIGRGVKKEREGGASTGGGGCSYGGVGSSGGSGIVVIAF